MTLFGFLLFTVIILLPLTLGLWKRLSIQRTTQNDTADFYHAQLNMLERDYAASLIDQPHYEAAKVEIQRRLLNTSIEPPESSQTESRGHGVIALSTLALIPLLGMVLYGINGVPFFSAQSADDHSASSPTDTPAEILKQLGDSVAHLVPQDPDYVPKHILLGQVKAQMGLTDQAIAEWRAALAVHFTPELALRIAEAETSRDGHVTPEALELYRQALDAAPKNAPWRLAVETRIAAGTHEKDQKIP